MLTELAPNIFLQRHPLRFASCEMGRVVTLIRLASGKIVIHSTANFDSKDVHAIREIGKPAWMVEATRFHDTNAKEGRKAFPDLPYLVPQRFKGPGTGDLLPAPEEWKGELEVIEIRGMPKIREHVFFHCPSKTLIVADLLFNLSPEVSWWTKAFLRVASGMREYPAMSRLFRLAIKDRAAFQRSIETILKWDFERIVVAHGDPIESKAKDQLKAVLSKNGLHHDHI